MKPAEVSFRPLRKSPGILMFPLTLALLPGLTAAQLGESDEAIGMLEEIIVTAQKREQSLMDVPVAVSAITVLSVIGLLSGYFPARRAARCNPIEALRL